MHNAIILKYMSKMARQTFDKKKIKNQVLKIFFKPMDKF